MLNPLFRLPLALVVVLLVAVPAAAQPRYQILLKGGHVIDPRNQIDAVMDVAIADGKIAAVRPDINPAEARTVADVSGLYVTPGLIDAHTHVFATTGMRNAWAGDNSVLPDGFSFRSGVTTMVDVGSSGWRNFEDFRDRVIDRARTRVFAMLNIVGLGMMTDAPEQNVHDMDAKATAEMALKHRDVVVGIKSAHYQGPEWVSVDRAVEAGTAAKIPVMVDFGYFREERPYYKLVTERLRPGDISTHMFRGPVPYVDANGKLLDYLKQARARGVLFDVGHGGGSFVFRNAVPAIQQGFQPDTISTDLHTGSMNGAMIDMLTTMSKILVMGVRLQDVIQQSTVNPAKAIQHPELGHLGVGAEADVAVLRVLTGRFRYADGSRATIDGDRRLTCELTLKGGQVVWDWNARTGTDYTKMSKDYGIRPVDKIILPPGSPGQAQTAPAGAPAAAPAARGATPPAPAAVVSPEILSEGRVAFRLLGPQATEAAVQGIARERVPMVKGENGVWEAIVGSLTPGVYQYSFVVNGVQMADPRNQAVNETTTGFNSLLVVPGSDMVDTKSVPHGALAQVFYDSTVLGRSRRMHVYTPPGYGAGADRYPVFYLLHGSGDSDQSWSALGRAGIILDNLIAARKAKPMVLVMPAGHTAVPATPASREAFVKEFLTDIVPFVEKNYRVRTDRSSRAIAGLSMGGGQTLNIAMPHLEKFAYVGVFSAGLSGGGGGRGGGGASASPAEPYGESWEKQHQAALDNASLKKGLKLLWFGIGKEDAALANATATASLLKKHGFNPVFHESDGGHTWPNWRDYLVIFAPQLF